jgi:hypothetical protein
MYDAGCNADSISYRDGWKLRCRRWSGSIWRRGRRRRRRRRRGRGGRSAVVTAFSAFASFSAFATFSAVVVIEFIVVRHTAANAEQFLRAEIPEHVFLINPF